MPRFKYDRVDFVAAERPVLLGRREFQRTLGTGCCPAVKSKDDIAGEVISDPARADADALPTQMLEIAYACISPSDNGECFRVKGDYRAELGIRAGRCKRPLTLESGHGDVGLRQAKR